MFRGRDNDRDNIANRNDPDYLSRRAVEGNRGILAPIRDLVDSPSRNLQRAVEQRAFQDYARLQAGADFRRSADQIAEDAAASSAALQGQLASQSAMLGQQALASGQQPGTFLQAQQGLQQMVEDGYFRSLGEAGQRATSEAAAEREAVRAAAEMAAQQQFERQQRQVQNVARAIAFFVNPASALMGQSSGNPASAFSGTPGTDGPVPTAAGGGEGAGATSAASAASAGG